MSFFGFRFSNHAGELQLVLDPELLDRVQNLVFPRKKSASLKASVDGWWSHYDIYTADPDRVALLIFDYLESL